VLTIGDFIDYYELLGVSPRASKELIKRAYRISAKGSHPDSGGSDAAFIKTQMAYETLSNDLKRREYDEIYNRVMYLKNHDIGKENQDTEKQFGSQTAPTNNEETTYKESKKKNPLLRNIISGFILLTILAKLLHNIPFMEDREEISSYSNESYSNPVENEVQMEKDDNLVDVGEIFSNTVRNETLEEFDEIKQQTAVVNDSYDIDEKYHVDNSRLSADSYSEHESQLILMETELELGAEIWEFGSDSEIVSFTVKEFQMWDDQLNEIYGVLREQLPEGLFVILRDSQREWIKYRDKIADLAIMDFKGGSWESAIYNSTRAEETRKRCYWLLTNFEYE